MAGGSAHFLADQVAPSGSKTTGETELDYPVTAPPLSVHNPFPTVVAGDSAHFLADQGRVKSHKMTCHLTVHNPFPSVVAGGSAHFLGKLKIDAQIEHKKRKKRNICNKKAKQAMRTDLPTGSPTDHPTWPPTDPPIESGPPTDHPTGPPTDPPIEYYVGVDDDEESKSDDDEEDDGMYEYEQARIQLQSGGEC